MTDVTPGRGGAPDPTTGADAGPRLWFVNRFFHPDVSATSRMLSDLAFGLAREGERVSIVTSRLRYDRPEARLVPRERVGGVDVVRVPSTRFGRVRLAGRLADYASFYVSVALHLLRHGRRGDTLVVKTDPPLMAVVLLPVAAVRGLRLVNWLQDLFPEVAEAAGLGRRALVARALAASRALRDATLRRADANVVIGPSMAERVRAAGAVGTITEIPNWADAERLLPVAPARNALRADWGLVDRFVVCYSGNLGFAHPFETLLGAATRLAAREDIVFLFIGGGVQHAALRAAVDARGLGDTVRFRPYQPEERLAESLSSGDVHLVTLAPSMEGLVLPSKLYGIGAVARPVLFVGDPDGDVARAVRERDCGAVFAPDADEALADAIAAYAADPERRAREGENGRRAVLAHNTPAVAVRCWLALLGRDERPERGATRTEAARR